MFSVVGAFINADRTIIFNIRKYGGTFYIGITMVGLPYIGTMGKLKYQFSLSDSTQFDFYQY